MVTIDEYDIVNFKLGTMLPIVVRLNDYTQLEKGIIRDAINEHTIANNIDTEKAKELQEELDELQEDYDTLSTQQEDDSEYIGRLKDAINDLLDEFKNKHMEESDEYDTLIKLLTD